MFEVLIIGSGPAGLYAAYNAGMRHLKAGIIESLPYVGGQLTTLYRDKPVYDLPGHVNITAGEFINQLYTQFRRFEDDIPIYFDTVLTDVEKKEDHFVVHTNKGDFETRTLVLSTGGGRFEPRKLKAPGADEASNIKYKVERKEEYKGKNVAVLGGGDSAFDWANMLSDVAENVYLVHRRADFRAHESSVEKFEKRGTIHANYAITEVNDTGIKLLHNDNNEELEVEVDEIVVNYGFRPTKSFLANWDIWRSDDAFIVHTNQETSQKNIFAIGNASTYEGKFKNISSGLGEATTCIGVINKRLYPGKTKQFLK